MHVFIWHKWKGMLTWNRSLKMKHLKKGEKYMNWCYKHYAMIIPCLHHQEIYELMLWLPNLHYAMFASCVKISRTCIVILRIDILPYDEMLQLMNTWNVILYLIDFSINLCLSYMNLLNVILRMISDLTNAWFIFTT